MKFKANFEEFKKAITTCGKGLKKGAWCQNINSTSQNENP